MLQHPTWNLCSKYILNFRVIVSATGRFWTDSVEDVRTKDIPRRDVALELLSICCTSGDHAFKDANSQSVPQARFFVCT